jgi:hypothetical protein
VTFNHTETYEEAEALPQSMTEELEILPKNMSQGAGNGWGQGAVPRSSLYTNLAKNRVSERAPRQSGHQRQISVTLTATVGHGSHLTTPLHPSHIMGALSTILTWENRVGTWQISPLQAPVSWPELMYYINVQYH